MEKNEMKSRGEHSNILLTCFKGKTNASKALLDKIRTNKSVDKAELTNSFETSVKELNEKLKNNYKYVISFGQKPSAKEVLIELLANKNDTALKTNFPKERIEAFFKNNKINFSISNDTKMIFMHIPSMNHSFDFDQLAHGISECIDFI